MSTWQVTYHDPWPDKDVTVEIEADSALDAAWQAAYRLDPDDAIKAGPVTLMRVVRPQS